MSLVITRGRLACLVSAVSAIGIAAPAVLATDIDGVFSAAVDQPQISAAITSGSANGPVLEGSDGEGFNVTAYFDTGASGIMFSNETATALGIGTTSALFHDVGVNGSDTFGISQPYYLHLAPSSFDPTDPFMGTSQTWAASKASYTQSFGPVKFQISQGSGTLSTGDPLLDELNQLMDPMANVDVIGTPAMAGKVVVMDARPVNALVSGGFGSILTGELPANAGSMTTQVIDSPGRPINKLLASDNPAIPRCDRHVQLSMASFDKYTKVDGGTLAADGPTMTTNPFIGTDPTSGQTTNNSKGITVTLGGKTSRGSWLLDTGAAASMISSVQAQTLGIHAVAGATSSDAPTLEYADGSVVPDQFSMAIAGVGGTSTVSGFYLDSLTVPTLEGDPLVFHHAPVLVSDIGLKNPDNPGDTLTLDGVFGMNYLVASVDMSAVDPNDFTSILSAPMAMGAFNDIVFDQSSALLGVTFVPEPATFTLLLLVGATGLMRRRRAA